MGKKKKYTSRTDLEKIQSQWVKLSGLHSREEWSAAVVRAATAAEIAANFAIRREFEGRSKFDAEFVDSLLKWGNGLQGKMDRLLGPLVDGDAERKAVIKELKTVAKSINDKRNDIAHKGEFCSASKSKAVIEASEQFVQTLVRLYEPDFELKERSKPSKSSRRSKSK